MILADVYLKNFILIEDSHIPFAPGLNIITGETGAGKSILLEAVMILLGKKLTRDHVKHAGKPCLIEGSFYLNVKLPQDKAAQKQLEDIGVPVEERFVIRRMLDASGRQKTLINEQALSLPALHEVFSPLIEICGQHEYHGLLRAEAHLQMLDEGLGKDATALKAYHESYAQYRNLASELDELEKHAQAWKSKADYVAFQESFFKDKRPTSQTEDSELEDQLRTLKHSEKIKTALTQALETLEDTHTGVLRQLRSCDKALNSLTDLHLLPEQMIKNLRDVIENVRDISQSLERELERLPVQSTHDVDQLNERLFFLQTLKSKYGPTLEDVCRYIDTIEQELKDSAQLDEKIQSLKTKLEKQKQSVLNISHRLLAARKARARVLQTQMNTVLKELGIATPQFEVQFTEIQDQPAPRGSHDIEFYMSFNAGKACAPVRKIASGGELSRLMLAFRALNARSPDVGIYLFDEVDAGVGGQTARKIGMYLQRIAQDDPASESSQVMCITHLPQIAAFADHHILVEKRSVKSHTEVKITPLISTEERVLELVRMIGGDIADKHALLSAQKLQKEAGRKNSKRAEKQP